MESSQFRRHRWRHRSGARVAALAALGALGAGALATAPAEALNYVTGDNGDTWQVQDAAIPGVDTGSVRTTTDGGLQGFGGLRVRISGLTTPRLNGALMRGFGLRYDGQSRFKTTTDVDMGGVSVSRSIRISRAGGWGRWLDTFTNTSKTTATVETAFGGQLGYNTGSNQSQLLDSSSGDRAITPADSWAEVGSPTTDAGNPSFNGPSAVVIGSPTPFSGGLLKTGNFLRDPFDNPLETSGDEANHYGYVNKFTLAPGQTKSLAHFVAIGLSETRAAPNGGARPAAGSQVAAVKATAQTLAARPVLDDLSDAQICSLVNWDVANLTVAGFTQSSCATAARIEPTAHTDPPPTPVTSSPYDVTDKTITQMQADMAAGRATSQEITRAYLDRIAAYDVGQKGFHAFITVASDAMAQARQADAERALGRSGELLGIPMAIKDLYDTKDMPTTGGSLVFDGFRPQRDAFQVAQLRNAGAVILGKANLAEYANDGYFSPSAYGQVWNAFDPSKSSIGSSGGSAVAVATSMAGAALGTQTGDSLWGPSSAASLFSLRGTDGMESTDGVMPLTWAQDYGGIIARSAPDLAALLNTEAVPNPADPLTFQADGHRPADWDAYLDADALRGKTIGYYPDAFSDPFGTTGTRDAMFAEFRYFEAAGARVVAIQPPPAAPPSTSGDKGYEGWLRWIEIHPESPYQDPGEILNNQRRLPEFRAASTTYSGTGPMTETEQAAFLAYRQAYRASLSAWMDAQRVDAVVFPGQLSDIHLNDSIQPSFGRLDPHASAAGVPNMIFPVGTNDHGQPINLQLEGRPFDDPKLLGFAYAFELRANGHVAPGTTPALTYDAGAQPHPIVVDTPPPPITDPPHGGGGDRPGEGDGDGGHHGEDPGHGHRRSHPKPTVHLTSTKIVLDRHWHYAVGVACGSGAGTCHARVTVTRKGHTLAHRTVAIKAGKKTVVRFTAPKSVRRSLPHGGTLTARVALAGVGGTVVKKVTVKKR
ncbi:amidase [Conexibacter sp. CPCC 206217]|uniref:amidase n=1 Tax=Conexibacter sp. CPCC 206217 TaxID=3064574 RepID=UPI00271656E2|nr:amidase [Conexibacter sp. CPCC 206217]MDO8210960.1 amidase [Conexibacter sp. CPCC 206217]